MRREDINPSLRNNNRTFVVGTEYSTLFKMTNADVNQIKSQIQENLIQTGEYDKITRFLKLKLYENGWFDQVKQLALKEVATSDEVPNFTQLLSFLEPKALDMVPDSAKQETLEKIKQYLDTIIE